MKTNKKPGSESSTAAQQPENGRTSTTRKIRTRIAPSPTGYLHIGTARTALFNWLFARKNGGEFILRIEDTDLERSEKKYEKDIIDNLRWLGLDWNGEITRQSDRLKIYKKYIEKLLKEGLAYYCFCSKEELEDQRQAMLSRGMAPKYSGRCRSLSEKEVKEKLAAGESHIIRFRVPEIKVKFTDLIRGEIEFDAALFGDIAIAKDPDTPLYNFAVVVDDFEMEISHVIRGEDHLANTPKQILLQKALGFSQPEYAHLPLILDPDRSKMSKRHSATSIVEYREDGYLPEAMLNFMAFLGWHPAPKQSVGTGQAPEKELISLAELVEEFDLSRVQKSGAVFNIEKLNWINSQYIKKIDPAELAKLLKTDNLKAVELVKERMKKLSDFEELADFFEKLPDYDWPLLIWKETPKEKITAHLKAVLEILKDGKNGGAIMQLAEKEGRGETLWPLRAALSGKENSPGPLEILDALGQKESARRIKTAIKKLENSK